MKKGYSLYILFFLYLTLALTGYSQANIDTLAIQDFEVVPAAPTWNFTGPVIYNSGFSSATASPPNSPLGIGGSRAWETTTNSGGLILDFDNITVPVGYDSIRVHFNLAAMNLVNTGGGPDNLDYVLVAYSLDNGMSYTNRLRIRGAVNDNSFWAYDATGVAKVNYLPATEALFQPINSGLQTTLGYSNCEIVFPGSVTQVKMRITGRSSSSTDTWLIDNLLITGENQCTPSTSNINATTCGNYTAPSGAVYSSSGLYSDTISNVGGCDSVIAINLTVNNPSTSTLNPVVCGSYLSPAGNTYTSTGVYVDTVSNFLGCDSTITINLTVNSASSSSISEVACNSYLSPAGNTYTSSGNYTDTILNFSGCDSIITIALTIHVVNTGVTQAGAQLTATISGAIYQWYDCTLGAPIAGATGQSFTASTNGSYALIISENGCTDTSSCFTVSGLGVDLVNAGLGSVYPNPVKDYCTIRFNTPKENLNLVLTDPMGRIILQKTYTQVQQVDLNMEELPAGIYLVSVYQGSGEPSFIKIIKQ